MRPFANCRAESGTVHEAAPGDPHSVDKDLLRRDPVIELDRVDSDDHVERRGDLCGLDVPRVFRFDRHSCRERVSHSGRIGRRSRVSLSPRALSRPLRAFSAPSRPGEPQGRFQGSHGRNRTIFENQGLSAYPAPFGIRYVDKP